MSSTLDSDSSDQEVMDSYDDNGSYEEDASKTKALAFKTACRLLTRRLPMSAARDGQQMTRESLDREIADAKEWITANPGTSGAGSLRVRHGDFQRFRE